MSLGAEAGRKAIGLDSDPRWSADWYPLTFPTSIFPAEEKV